MRRRLFYCCALLIAGASVGDAVAAESASSLSFSEEIDQAKSSMMADPAAALRHAREAHRIDQLSGGKSDQNEAEAAWLEGEALTRLNRASEARPILEAAVALIAAEDAGSKLHADLLKAYAAAARVTENTTEALASLHEAHSIYRNLGEARAQAIVLQNLGMLHIEANDLDRALDYFDQADRAYSDDPALQIGSFTNRGRIYEEQLDFDRAVGAYRAAMKLASEMESDLLQARIMTNLAFAEMKRGELATAEAVATKALAFDAAADGGGSGVLHALLARVALGRGEKQKALSLIDRAFDGVDISKTTTVMAEAHQTAGEVYGANNKGALAVAHFLAYDRLKAEAMRIAAQANNALMSARFDATNRDLQISRLESDQLKKTRQLEASRAETERVALAGFAVLALIAAFFVFNRSKTTRRRHHEITRMNAKLIHAAGHDALTDLPNRKRSYDLLTELLNPASAATNVAMMMIDLDEFKDVNDTMGHHVGDAVLREIAGRLTSTVQPGDFIGRLGGDEFIVLARSFADDAELATYADAIIACVCEPLTMPEGRIQLGCSIGIALPDETTAGDPDALARNADLALYAAKESGRRKSAFFDPDMLVAAEDSRLLLNDLKVALTNGELSVFYQPLVCARSHDLIGYEALLRWRHPKHGMVPPNTFIPLAEGAGLIPEIGAWVMEAACTAAASMPDHVVMAVNVSPLQFDGSLSDTVLTALAATGLAPHRLQLEVTESVFLRGAARTAKEFSQLGAIGVSFAIDDFGTGYSSLGYLQRADFAKIKIDRAFVSQAGEGCKESIAIIKAIVALAKSLEMDTTAEGIETAEEATLMRALGCTQFQGYFFGMPKPLESDHDSSKSVVALLPSPSKERPGSGVKAAAAS